MVFTFNFNVEGKGEKRKAEEEESDIKWKQAKEIFLNEDHYDRISSLMCVEIFPLDEESHEDDKGSTSEEGAKASTATENGETKNKNTLNFINSETAVTNLKSSKYEGDLTPALEEKTDLVPGVYEGGLKIWECSEDLVKYLYREYTDKLEGKRVLELGCGAGLPGVFAFTQGAEVDFNDYNCEVLEEITIPNVLLNVPEESHRTATRFFSGDWGSLNDLLGSDRQEDSKYDIILTSETIYNSSNQNKLINIFKDQLKKEGKVYVAAKTYYFGVGGGVREFHNKLEENGFTVQVVYQSEEGVKREILCAQFTS